MLRIRIVKTPPGSEFPENIRRSWVGIELESSGLESERDSRIPNDLKLGRYGGKENSGGYEVSGRDAVIALFHHNKEAYTWLVRNHGDVYFGVFVFNADVCEVVPVKM